MRRRKGLGFISRMYGGRGRLFVEADKGYRLSYTKAIADLAEIEQRTLAYVDMDFAEAAGRTLAAVNSDPRNHFGKYALRRFE